MHGREDIQHDDQAAAWRASEVGNRTLDFIIAADGERKHLGLQGRRRRGNRLQEETATAGRGLRIEDDTDACGSGRDLLEQFDPLAAHRRFEIGKAGDVAAGPCQVGDESVAHGIGDRDKHYRDGRGLIRHRLQGRRGLANNQVRFQTDQLPGVIADPIDVAGAKAIGDRNVAALLPAKLLERLPEGCHARLGIGLNFGVSHQDADSPDAIRLRPRRA